VASGSLQPQRVHHRLKTWQEVNSCAFLRSNRATCLVLFEIDSKSNAVIEIKLLASVFTHFSPVRRGAEECVFHAIHFVHLGWFHNVGNKLVTVFKNAVSFLDDCIKSCRDLPQPQRLLSTCSYSNGWDVVR
jgi:hypothetical protein